MPSGTARDSNLDIVTADGKYHEALLATDEDDIFDALLRQRRLQKLTADSEARRDLGQLVIALAGINLKALPPDRIPELQASKRFAAFGNLLRRSATNPSCITSTACCRWAMSWISSAGASLVSSMFEERAAMFATKIAVASQQGRVDLASSRLGEAQVPLGSDHSVEILARKAFFHQSPAVRRSAQPAQ